MSGREQLVLVRPRGKLLVMTGLVYPKKIKNPADYEGEVDEIDFKPEEVALANTLIGASKIDEFDFTKNSDQYVAKLRKVIDLKVQGAEIVQAPDHEEPKILNLMDALKKSVAEAQSKLVGGEPDEADKGATRKKLAPSTGRKKGSRKVGN